MKKIYLFLLLFGVLCNSNVFAQCTCPASCITSISTGNWDDCTKWTGVSCVGWATATIMGNRRQVVQNGHTITVPATVSTFHGRSMGIYVQSGGTLNVGGAVDGVTYSASAITVCGTMNVTAATSDFSSATLTVNSGGVLNVSGGILKVDGIVVKSGGIINISGTGSLSRDNAASGLTVEQGGIININSSTAKLDYHGLFGTLSSLIDGTIDVKNSMTSSNGLNVYLGNTRVTNNTSTGRIRTQNAYLPSSDMTVPTTFSNNFFGSNSDYGGTIEFYGASTITLNNLATNCRYYYYDVEVNTTGGVNLGHNTTYIRGALRLTAGLLRLNGKKLILIGTVVYTGSNYILGDVTAELEWRGKLSTTTLDSPGMTTFMISSNGGTLNCKNPDLRMSAATGGTANLKRLRLNREDVVYLRSQLTVNDSLLLDEGKLRTDIAGASFVIVTNTASGSVRHKTTGWTGSYGYVSGKMRRYVTSNTNYDFPVGYPNETLYDNGVSTPLPNHRRARLEIRALTGITYFDAYYTPSIFDCAGSLTAVDPVSLAYYQIHPEGSWDITPNTNTYTIDYDVKLFTWGYNTPTLVDDMYGVLKRPSGSTLCTDWNTGGGLLPTAGTAGRIIMTDNSAIPPIDTSYAKRLNLVDFSEMAIGIIQGSLPVQTYNLQANYEAPFVNVRWNTVQISETLILEKSIAGKPFDPIDDVSGKTTYRDEKLVLGKQYYRLKSIDKDGKQQYSSAVEVNISELPKTYLYTTHTELYLKTYQTPTQIAIVDMTGKTLLQTAYQPMIPISDYPSGVYFLRVSYANRVETLKFVK